MKILTKTTLIAGLCSTPLFALNWNLQKVGNQYLAKLQGQELSRPWTVPLEGEGEPVEIVSFQSSTPRKNIALLIYHAGTVGTYDLVRLENAAVLDIKNQKILGHFPWKYRFADKRKEGAAEEITQPRWNWSKESLVVEDPAFLSGGRIEW